MLRIRDVYFEFQIPDPGSASKNLASLKKTAANSNVRGAGLVSQEETLASFNGVGSRRDQASLEEKEAENVCIREEVRAGIKS